MENLIPWLKGLAAALITGAANALTLAVVDPTTFDYTDAAGLKRIVSVVVVSGVIAAAAYLKQSPLPGVSSPGGGDA